MWIVAGRAIRLPDRTMMIGIGPQKLCHIFKFPAVFQGDFVVMTGEARVKGRLLQ